MPASLYFGAPVKAKGTASKEVLDLGLDYLRASPSEIAVTTIRTYNQPGYTLYKANLPAFIYLGSAPGSRISSRRPIYFPLTHKDVSSTITPVTISFSFSQQKSPEQIAEIIAQTGATESQLGNKLIFKIKSGPGVVAKVTGLRPAPITVTQTGTDTMNLKGYRVYGFLHRLFDAFCKVNQYPGFRTHDISDVGTLDLFHPLIENADHKTKLESGPTNAARSIRDVNRELTTRGFLQAREEEIIRKAHLLSFPGQSDYFAVTAYNIEKVFQAMGNATISEADFPLHPDAVTSTKRDERLLSAFGSEVPSFRVPGGKKMSLSGNFAVKMREANGKMELKDVHAIGAILVPLAKGYQDYIAMKNDQEILNPFGSRLANQASSSSIVKKWEKDTCTTVVAALRSAVGASANVPANENKKRKADDDEIDDRYHRVDAFDFLDI